MQLRHQLKSVRYSYSNYRNYGSLTKFQVDQQTLQHIDNKQYHMINYYRKHGHLAAKLDPLKLLTQSTEFPSTLDFGVKYNDNVDTKDLLMETPSNVEQLEQYLQSMYTNTVGVQFDHIEDPSEQEWLYKEYERCMNQKITTSERVNIQNILIQTEAIDHYLHKKFTTFKRYAGEGGESTAIALRAIYAYASELGVTDVVQSMAHRGRFPIMASLLDFPASDIFRKIMGNNDMPTEYTYGTCDVVHHLSSSNKRRFPGAGCKENDIRITVVHNPSHLEAANPVSQGKTKAKQDDYGNVDQVLNLQMHGDAAFVGQGIVYESLLLAGLDNYSNGGTIHIIQNNQIGYTTNLKDSRSTRYCSDVMLGYKYPIIHVNGDDVEAVHKVSKLAVAYRQYYKRDIIIDLYTYRRYGHNEVDEPSFTQPNMYNQIRQQQMTLPQLYNKQLTEEKVAQSTDYEKVREKVFKHLDAEYEKAKTITQTMSRVTDPNSKGSKAFSGKWKNMTFSQFGNNVNTGLVGSHLSDLAKQSVLIKEGFNLHPRLKKYFIDDRLEQVEKNNIDWATAEAVAVSSLLEGGYNVRLSGQDVERGTFSQRHWVFVDQKTEEKWIPMQSLADAKNQGRLQVVNSPLSEAAVMAFDFGYGMENPNNLVIWEAQFGDFYNTGQSIVDTYITCSEEKWMRQSSLVMMLPHGFDGAGPEHSSSRMERWLQMGVQQQNFQFVFPSTPSSIFHLLRRQMLRNFRKPLIIASAKSLLRAKSARCSFESLNGQFQPIIVHSKSIETAQRVFFTYGKMVHELIEILEQQKHASYAVIALEQLLPFPQSELNNLMAKISKSAKIHFLQEEPRNAGGFEYCRRFLDEAIQKSQIQDKNIGYIGRLESPLVAVGATVLHNQQLNELKQAILSAL